MRLSRLRYKRCDWTYWHGRYWVQYCDFFGVIFVWCSEFGVINESLQVGFGMSHELGTIWTSRCVRWQVRPERQWDVRHMNVQDRCGQVHALKLFYHHAYRSMSSLESQSPNHRIIVREKTYSDD
jgi:hypothetical protein